MRTDKLRMRMPPSPCPKCTTVLDGAGDPLGRNAPKPGDFTVCLFCAEVLQYDRQMQLQIATRQEILRHAPAHLERLRRTIADALASGELPGPGKARHA
jgi:hypothetical protein